MVCTGLLITCFDLSGPDKNVDSPGTFTPLDPAHGAHLVLIGAMAMVQFRWEGRTLSSERQRRESITSAGFPF